MSRAATPEERLLHPGIPAEALQRAIAAAVEVAAANEDSEEEMTDAQQSSDEGEEEEVEDAAASAEPADGAGGDSIGGRNPALRAAAAAVAAAAAAAVAAAAAGAEGESARCWNKDMVSLAATAQMHMQAGKLDRAINEYSDMLGRSSMAGGAALGDNNAGGGARARHAALLLGRSAANAAFSQQLRSIPAAQSESRALYAPDPTQLAALALKDAEAAAAMQPDSPEPLLHKGVALALLERYEAAEAAYHAGLALQLTHGALRAQLQGLQAGLAEGRARGDDGGGSRALSGGDAGGEATVARQPGRQLQLTDDTECVLCMKLLFEPVTTPCGHTFCKPCFSRAMDHANKCPNCRTVLHAGRELAVTITLKNVLERSFPEEYEQRRQEERAAVAAAAEPAGDAPLPVFVMSLLLPGECMALNIFEPRYRLMVRRCMEGNRRLGMATVNRQHELFEVATEAEIVECQPLPDGRFYIEIAGRRRFRPAETWELDGYRVARPEYLADEPPAEGSEEAAALASEAAAVEALADTWVERLRSLSQTRRGVAELLTRAGDKPAAASSSPEALSFWVANLICPVLDVEAALKQRFLGTRDTLERLLAERQVLAQLNASASPQGCTLM
ncbi:LON peptidase N-terminal domain and RING finger 1 isoform B [Micractinium conductrix]|uniref:LON peptidase N-terminal domain and RING finger 1 isoform B n=1 Tax=Micractinium conductrix TaxID=554055 RepID=A0A2P6VJB5_9CHLO|nr:LON peptidase N-terminal domain and RING finger 1 isoform B [Micractinium conductrix]|eukprot:PSC74157.1 LON peptidase N-terminal domain and RING finger 1 isoform B [Micractinium conductrix]